MTMKHLFCIAGLIGVSIVLAGCGQDASLVSSGKAGAGSDNSSLISQLEESELQRQRLQKQLEILRGLKENIEAGQIYDLQTVEMGRYTDFYDKNDDGKKETLIVHLRPIDSEGDVIKAAGKVEVELWDLSESSEGVKIGEWTVLPGELKKCWAVTILTTSYRLRFDVSEKLENATGPLTAKFTFYNLLNAKIFQGQKAITP